VTNRTGLESALRTVEGELGDDNVIGTQLNAVFLLDGAGEIDASKCRNSLADTSGRVAVVLASRASDFVAGAISPVDGDYAIREPC
jgi:hypothetical protein